MSIIPKATNLCNNTSTFVSPICTFSLAGNIIIYTPNQGTNRENYFNLIIYKRKMPTLHPFFLFFFDRIFWIFRQKNIRVESVRYGHQSGYSRTDTINNNINKTSKRFSIRKNTRKCTKYG